MWQKVLVIILLFYFFALLQNSFLPYFNLFGAVPNLVFIFFSLIIFFEDRPKGFQTNYQIIFWAVTAGFFLDILSYTYIGPSTVLLIAIGFTLKKLQSLLKNRDDNYPLIYFLPLSIGLLLTYNLLMGLYLYFLDPNKITIAFGLGTLFMVIYNLLAASAFFYLYKKFFRDFANG